MRPSDYAGTDKPKKKSDAAPGETPEEEVPPVGMRWVTVPVKSALPYWIAAIVFFVFGLIVPIYRIGLLLLGLALAFFAGWLTKCGVKPETKRILVPFTTGNPEIDDAVAEFERAAAAIEKDRLAVENTHPTAAAQMGEIVTLTRKLGGLVAEDAEDLHRCRRFMNYYLPTTVKLADKYVYITGKESGENVDETRASIESAFVTVRDAFRKQYDALFADDALDITTDVTVLETMLKKDGIYEGTESGTK